MEISKYNSRRRNRFTVVQLIVGFAVAVAAAAAFSGCAGGNSGSDFQAAEAIGKADTLFAAGEYLEAMDKLKPFANPAEAPQVDTALLLRAYDKLIRIHFVFEDHRGALTYLDVQKRYLAGGGAPDGRLSQLYHRENIVYCFLHNRAKAESARDSLARYSLGDAQDLYYGAVSDAYMEKTFGLPDRAIRSMERVIALVDSAKMDPINKGTPMSEIIDIYMETDRPDSALVWLGRFRDVTEPYGNHEMHAEMLRGYLNAYTRLGDKRNAIEYGNEYMSYTDSVLNREKFIEQSSRFHAEYVRETEADISSLRFELSFWQTAIIILVSIGLTAGSVVAWQTSVRRRARKLFRRNRELAMLEQQMLHTPAGAAEGGNVSESPSDEEEDAAVAAGSAARRQTPDETLRSIYPLILEQLANPDNFCNPDFSLGRLSDILGINVNYVSQAINKYSGKNFRGLLNDFRVREARVRLSDTENYGHLTLQSVAESVGFASASAFIRAFKMCTGMTPSLYQKMARSGEPDDEIQEN